MKNRTLLSVVVLAGAGFLLASGVAFAGDKQGMGMSGEGHGNMHADGQKQMENMWKEEEKLLGLTKDQRARMKVLREEGLASSKAIREGLKARREALRQELDGDNPDRAKAESLVKEIGGIEQQLATARIDQIFKIRQILTPEQAKKLRALHQKKMEEMRAKRGKRQAGASKDKE